MDGMEKILTGMVVIMAFAIVVLLWQLRIRDAENADLKTALATQGALLAETKWSSSCATR